MIQARLVESDGNEVESLNSPGEVLLMSPTLFKGYLDNEEATRAAFDDRGWLRTGDIGMFKKSPNGAEHLFILDRIKEMIKVKVRSFFFPGFRTNHPGVRVSGNAADVVVLSPGVASCACRH
jgi:acyl-CoA synthetase (AMP-forming)/AMP-acid ligase II